MRITVLFATAAALCATAAEATPFVDPNQIDEAVSQFTGESIGAEGGARLPIDRRLKLAACPTALALEWYGSRRDSVLVRCPIEGGWRLFVPIATAPLATGQGAVARGDSVAIVVEGDGFTLSRQGEALEGGAVGDWIRVRPAGTKGDPLRARIVAPGKVGMNLP